MIFRKKKNEIAVVELKELVTTDEFNELSLVEIKDEKVISRIVSAVPGAAQVVGNTVVAAEAAGLANSGVYQAILPSGAKLVNSKATEGAVRGMFREGGKIAGNADFVSVDGAMKNIAAVNVANAAMGAASLVVGQYYMQQINAELNAISDGISRLQDYQKNEYKSKVLTLVTQVKRAADFQAEILEDVTLRAEEISRLQSLETTCMNLLNQANIEVEQISFRKYDTFDKYSQATKDISEWQKYQMMLVNVLFTIADLNYTFHIGALSPEQCYSTYDSSFKYTDKTIEKTKKWHLMHEETLGIDIDQAIFERKGLDAIVHKPLSLINDDFQYRSMKKQEVEKIRIQKGAEIVNRREENKNLYMEDAKIVFKNGKVFYVSV
ncbi:hypothetical protein [Pseudobutyrivibrio xylanivorans]|uniref:Uncharacterized protein n=1 Tax=Pseudobutyrivibrio xylanivorans TaxID=185007 RepID=A0A5P6VLD4_PSEXY|nr:hypothetical protein [Pseudobutyrivibrio xylanivorans]QFJ53378.1 hypothetical protein FXF36_00065 [Pseudobutyrivibrio xylanivorans]QFJ53455.1 hypothetical protein FXF36_00475 [Pseudobutyrivibrio xylanivorans]